MKYVKTFESFNEKTNEIFNFKAKKEKKELDELKSKAIAEIEKYIFERISGQYATTSDNEDIHKLIKSRIYQASKELPNLYKLLPDLFDLSDLSPAGVKGTYEREVVPLTWQFILVNRVIDKETAVKKLKEKIERVTKLP